MGANLVPAVGAVRLVAAIVLLGLVGAGGLEVGPRVLAGFVAFVILAAVLGRLADVARGGSASSPLAVRAPLLVGSGALGLLAVIGATAVAGGSGLLLMAAAGASWAVYRWVADRASDVLGRHARGRAANVEALERHLRLLKGEALCRLWCQCRQVFPVARNSVRQQLEMNVVRQAVLAELERRDPEAFSAWLARGAPDVVPPIRADGLA